MEWQTILGLVVGNMAIIFPLFLWNRSEANADRRDSVSLIRAIHEEMKDFHARLCVIESKQK